MDELEKAELEAVVQIKKCTDREIAVTLYRTVLKTLADGYSPDSVVMGLEVTVRALRTAANEKQLQEMAVPGVQ